MGAVQTTVPGVTVDDVLAAVRAAYATLGELRPAALPAEVVDAARARAERHRLPG